MVKKKSRAIVFTLSIKDLRHEWILTLCLVLAISAVISPLLLLFGLKYGIIQWGRDFLTQDPYYREIRPLASRSFDKEWFLKMENRSEVSFIIPMTRQISATVKANVKGKSKKESLNVIPTAENDPLILENGASIPGQNECVLTHTAADALKARAGDMIVIKASRIVGSRYEYGTVELKVASVLSLRASELKSMYVQLSLLEAIENYKDGQAVPELNWKGSIPKAYPLYDGVIIVLPEELSKVEESALCSKTGFTKIEQLDSKVLFERAGFRTSPEMAVYHLYTIIKPVGQESIVAVGNRLWGKDAVILKWVSPIDAQLIDESGQEIASVSLHALSVSKDKAQKIGLTKLPSWNDGQQRNDEILRVMVPSGIKITGEKFFLKVTKDGESLSFPVTVEHEQIPDSSRAFIPAALAGIIRLSTIRNIIFDKKVHDFILIRKGYAGFRLYAQSIFDVEGLRQFFEAESIPVHTEIREIKKVIDLDRAMTLIFLLLAFVAVTGSAASLIASLYASVERKKHSLSVLRLIGLSRFTLFRFPIYQSMVISLAAFGLSLIIFKLSSQVINTWFRPYVNKLLGFPIEAAVEFCYIPLSYIHIASGGALLISICAAMAAAIRVTRIEPAEALRDE